MTANYNVHIQTSKNYFFENIEENHPLILKNLNLREKLTQTHNKFYFFLKNELFELFFLKNIKEFLDSKARENNYFRYAKIKRVEKTIKLNNNAVRYICQEYLEEEDVRKTNQAFAANFIHSSDAKTVHYLINKTGCFTIHDAFIINIFKLHQVMDELNNFFNSYLDGKEGGYAFFIAL